jgi:lysozyme family protein
MADFKIADAITRKNEGGLANNKNDKGGLTYKGIAYNYWKTWGGWSKVQAEMKKFNNNVKLANAELAKDADLDHLVSMFYMANFWNVLRLSDVHDQQVANNIYDFGVNAGTGRAAHFAQDSCIALGKNIKSDGGIGNLTIAAINSVPPKQLYDKINQLRDKYYRSLDDFDEFGHSWLSRIVPYKS